MTKRKFPLQLRLDPSVPVEARAIELLEKSKVETGLSLNTLANMAISAGLPTAVRKLRDLHDPEKQAA